MLRLRPWRRENVTAARVGHARPPGTCFLHPRCHRYDFRYKQSVTTSDNFLGMSGKDPSSTCCEQLVVVLQLPQTASAAGQCGAGAVRVLRQVSQPTEQWCRPHEARGVVACPAELQLDTTPTWLRLASEH
jgi:hypothetical protein